MGRRQEDPRVTDLRRYRKARDLQRRQARARPPNERLLGERPRAGLILMLVVLALVIVGILPYLF